MAKKPVKPKLYVDLETQTYTIDPPEGGDDPWRHQGNYGADVYFRGVSLKSKPYTRYSDECEVSFEPKEGDIVYVLYCVHTSGSTFGSTGGYTNVVGIFQKAETAYAAQRRILAHYDHFHRAGRRMATCKPTRDFKDQWYLDLKDDDGNTFEVHVGWYDFFGGLDDVQVAEGIVEDA